MLNIELPPGEALRIKLEEADGEFIISYDFAGNGRLIIQTPWPGNVKGGMGIIYEENFNADDEDVAKPVEPHSMRVKLTREEKIERCPNREIHALIPKGKACPLRCGCRGGDVLCTLENMHANQKPGVKCDECGHIERPIEPAKASRRDPQKGTCAMGGECTHPECE